MRLLAVVFAFLVSLFSLAAPAQAAVDVRVDLSTQTMRVTGSDGETYVWKVSSGKKGYSTPRGAYRSQRLERMHYSRKYDNAPMPHSIFFRGGYAIHATSAVGRLGSAASHGCVRLAPGNAAKLYAMVQREGARITITGDQPSTMTASRASKTRLAKAERRRAKAYAARSAGHERMARAAQGRPASASWYYSEPNAMGYAPAQRQQNLRQWMRSPAR
jgi:hypothetical protein